MVTAASKLAAGTRIMIWLECDPSACEEELAM